MDPARPAAADREGLRGAGERGAWLSVALALTADAALSALKPEQRVIAKRILLRLVQFGEGRLDTRRQQPTAALRRESEALFQQVLQHLVEHRLLTMSRLCVSRRRHLHQVSPPRQRLNTALWYIRTHGHSG